MKAFPSIEWTVLTLAPRYFSWRIRGNSLSWAYDERETLCRDYDFILATSMVDLSTLRGLVPALAKVPTVLYFHENQVEYPASGEASRRPFSLEPVMVQLYAALCADSLCFNSRFNRDSFISGIGRLLTQFPDAVPKRDFESLLTEKSRVLPVPIDDCHFLSGAHIGEKPEQEANGPKASVQVLWNHRWEYDKGPEALLAIISALPEESDLCFHIVGQAFRRKPEAFDDIHRLLVSRGWLGRWGFIEDKHKYHQLLSESQIVLSTAHHDFQGLSMLEASARGCVPIVPDRLAYKEIFPLTNRYAVPDQGKRKKPAKNSPSIDDSEITAAAALLLEAIASPDRFCVDVSGYAQEGLQVEYQSLFSSLLE